MSCTLYVLDDIKRHRTIRLPSIYRLEDAICQVGSLPIGTNANLWVELTTCPAITISLIVPELRASTVVVARSYDLLNALSINVPSDYSLKSSIRRCRLIITKWQAFCYELFHFTKKNPLRGPPVSCFVFHVSNKSIRGHKMAASHWILTASIEWQRSSFFHDKCCCKNFHPVRFIEVGEKIAYLSSSWFDELRFRLSKGHTTMWLHSDLVPRHNIWNSVPPIAFYDCCYYRQCPVSCPTTSYHGSFSLSPQC